MVVLDFYLQQLRVGIKFTQANIFKFYILGMNVNYKRKKKAGMFFYVFIMIFDGASRADTNQLDFGPLATVKRW